MTGELCILNVGEGDMKIIFNHHDDVEAQHAIQILTDMQQRGYAILIELDDGSYVRAKSIDAQRGRYIIGLPKGAAVPTDAEPVGKGKKKGSRKVSVPVESRKAYGVARSAGG
jgi:hypothetical protein